MHRRKRKATLVMLFHVNCSIEVPPVELTVLVAVLVSECGEVNKGRDCEDQSHLTKRSGYLIFLQRRVKRPKEEKQAEATLEDHCPGEFNH